MNIYLIPYILFSISFLFAIGVSLAIIIAYYSSFSENEYIWFCSKILTIKKMVSDNNGFIQAFYGYNEEGEILVLVKNYLGNLKLINRNGECIQNYRQCGILDTYGNKFCFPINEECPINEIIIDSPSKRNEYLNNGYDYYIYEDTEDYLYYKKGLNDKGIIAYWNISDSLPLYINENNFIFDIDAFEGIFGSTGENYKNIIEDISKEILIDESVDWAGDLLEDSSKLARIQKLIIYINEKIYEDENNIDKNFIKIYHDEYVKSYLGFENEDSIKKFEKIDFSLYKEYFPNYFYAILSFSCGGIFLLLLIINTIIMIYLIKNEEIGEKCEKCSSIISLLLYGSTFLCFYIFCLFNISQITSKTSMEYAKKIKADKFIENFLKEYYKHFEHKSLILCSIIFLTISGLLFIIGWIFGKLNRCIYERKIKQREERFRLQYQIYRFMGNINFPQQTENRQINTNVNQNSNSRNINRNVTTEIANKNNENNKKIEENIKNENINEENLEELVI